MRQWLVSGLYAIPLILYTLSAAYFMNQPIELINPFEYYNAMELPTMALYILMILLINVSMIGFIIGYHSQQIERFTMKSLIIFVVFGLCLSLLMHRMSIILWIALALVIARILRDKHLSQMKLLSITMGIYSIAIFVVIIPVAMMYWDYESYLNINQFQKFIEVNNKHHIVDYIMLNIDYFIHHLAYYLFVFIAGLMPGMLMGQYHAKQRDKSINMMIQALTALIIGTTLKLMVFKVSLLFLQFMLTLTGSSLQGLGLILMVLICVQYFEQRQAVPTFHISLFIAIILLVDGVVYALFTGIGKLPYPAQTIVQLLQYSIIAGCVFAFIYVVLNVILIKRNHIK
ncbi:hypothetical protein RW115_05695 [Macrococcus capreoli]